MMKKYFYLLGLLLVSIGAFAQNSLKVSGEVAKPLQLTLQDIAVLPHKTVILNDRDGKPHAYSGVTITTILAKAGVTIGKELRGENLSKYLLVRCADGYEVLFSLAELDGSFTDREVILADTMEGSPLPEAKGPFRIVVPNEKKPARSCFQVVELVVGYGND
jgi:DMSO/TMAO reductase YedYZ molybdopterin-dependent catalytic subunit